MPLWGNNPWKPVGEAIKRATTPKGFYRGPRVPSLPNVKYTPLKGFETNNGKKSTPERAESTSSSSGKKLSPERQARRERMMEAAQRNIDNKKKVRKAEAKASPVKREAMRANRYALASADKSVQAERQRRIGQHQFKGKYWGPEEFKGNQAMIDAWKAKGKPDRAAFAKSYNKK